MTKQSKDNKELNSFYKLSIKATLVLVLLAVAYVCYLFVLDAIESYRTVRIVASGVFVASVFIALGFGYKKVS